MLTTYCIFVVGVILWVPDSALDNPCTIKRHFAAISLVLSWAEMITLVARHPKLANLNIYVTMFYRVLRTFTLFLVWYSFFVIAFALGFYIMLHNDITLVENSMGFFRLQTSYSNLPKQVGILNPSIQIVFQNIENSSIREHVKIGLKTANFSRIS